MYSKPVHAETSIKALFEFIKANPLGVLTTAIPSSTHHLIQSTHIPWILDPVTDDPNAPIKGRLRGHMARQNPHSKCMMDACTQSRSNTLQQEVMVLFTGAEHHYVTPKFYTETKPASGKVVPTWNYAAAQVYGKATIHFDTAAPETAQFLAEQLHALSQHGETSVMGYTGADGKPGPWKVSDAPERYIEVMKKAITGIEVTIESIDGKVKMSQEVPAGDRRGVIQGFKEMGSDVGDHIAALVEKCGSKKDAERGVQ
ncbi:Transcriptional regulator PAI 2-type [Penicillium ucsense]|uniref:Transcriptional regulator PAI 2-type n=1 Tax=Penicillium ucsense TaxID=2839758 RepID=A0A8J8W3P5_9EURO|nr:Transcriptional regulator PAI 2-type [Penicillium ucsense]KAF7734486.1 Transcriptional regulator PAI 2-type [Penicillium ucsense]